jgi:acyl dehydratase
MTGRAIVFEEIKQGEVLPPLQKDVTLVQMVMYAAATWDFGRIHYDKDFVQNRGVSQPFVDGQMLGAFLAQLVTDWVGQQGMLRKLSFKNSAMVFPGDRLTCRGKVVRTDTEGGEKRVHCELWMKNQRGEQVVSAAQATVVLY